MHGDEEEPNQDSALSVDGSSLLGARHFADELSQTSSTKGYHQKRAGLIFAAAYDGDTNETLWQSVCNSAMSSIESATQIRISIIADNHFQLPSCLINATLVGSFTGNKLLVPSFAALPPNLTSFDCTTCNFGPSSVDSSPIEPASATPDGIAMSGFNDEGSIDWAQVWSILPLLTDLRLVKSNLRGGLPPSLPFRLVSFSLDQNTYSLGSLPTSLFSEFSGLTSIPSLGFTVTNCGLSGTISSSLFYGFNNTQIDDFAFVVSDNAIEASITDELFFSLGKANSTLWRFQVSNNKLSGSLPSLFSVGMVSPTNADFRLFLDGNKFDGPLPTNLFASLFRVRQLFFSVANNMLSGTLPAAPFTVNSWASTGLAGLSLDLSNNQFEGSIPGSFFKNSLSSSLDIVWSSITVDFSGNSLNGTIPEKLFYNDEFSKRHEAQHQSLKERSTLLGRESSTTASSSLVVAFITHDLTLDFSHNQLTGTIPSQLLVNVLKDNGGAPTLVFNLDDN